jgi:hypothetical protein
MREAWDRTDFERKKENKRRFKNGKLKELRFATSFIRHFRIII